MFRVITEGCQPSRASKYSSGVDLRSAKDITIHAGETVIVPLGVEIDLETLQYNWAKHNEFTEDAWEHFMKSHKIDLKLRSGLASKGLVINNGVGEIDLDFNKELGLIVSYPVPVRWSNKSPNTYNVEMIPPDMDSFTIKKGERVAQVILMEHKNYLCGYESEEKRDGGFGSTDMQTKTIG